MNRTSSIRKVQHAEDSGARALFGLGSWGWIPVACSLGSALAVAVLLAPHLALAQAPSDEYQVKAAFVYHFAQLVEWPPDALANDSQTLVFCSAGEDLYFNALVSVVQGKQIGSRSIQVRRVGEKDNLHGCHLLFVSGKDPKRGSAILASLKNAPVLTVGESENFAQGGGMIGLSLQENKVQFDINLKAAQRANLKISSRLLLLARSVISDGKQG